jgi:hypothetical protein
MAASLCTQGLLTAICERGRVARRVGHCEVLDGVAVLFGSAISGERPQDTLSERLQPCTVAYPALAERDRHPSRSARSRVGAALAPEPVDALRRRFLDERSREARTGWRAPAVWADGSTRDAVDGRRSRWSPRGRKATCRAPGSTGRTRGEGVRQPDGSGMVLPGRHVRPQRTVTSLMA